MDFEDAVNSASLNAGRFIAISNDRDIACDVQVAGCRP